MLKNTIAVSLCLVLGFGCNYTPPGECSEVGQGGSFGGGQGGSVIVGPGAGGNGETSTPQTADDNDLPDCNSLGKNMICVATRANGFDKFVDVFAEDADQAKTLCEQVEKGATCHDCVPENSTNKLYDFSCSGYMYCKSGDKKASCDWTGHYVRATGEKSAKKQTLDDCADEKGGSWSCKSDNLSCVQF